MNDGWLVGLAEDWDFLRPEGSEGEREGEREGVRERGRARVSELVSG